MNHSSGVGSMHSHYSGRNRSRSRQPVYTSDKRAKFTQRESKKWIRFITVLGYIVFVSLPAVCLSIYYVYIWDPQYLKNFPNHTMVNKSYTVYKPKDQRQTRQTFESPLYDNPPPYAKNNQECTCANPVPIRPTQEISPSLGHILSSSVSHEADASSKIEPERGQQLPTSQSSESRPISSSSESYSASQEFRSKSVEAG